jgi:FkbM family methyltransferase
MKTIISKFIRNKNLFKLWKFLNKLSNYGLNFGVASGYADYSGELYIIKKFKAKNIKNPVIFDVGANIGDWSKFVLQTFNTVPFSLHMFEPVTATFKVLKEQLTEKAGITFNKLALGNEIGTLTIHFEHGTQGSAGAFIQGSQSEEVKTVTLDAYCKENAIAHIDFLKMDVQGFEYQILKGAKELLEKKAISYIQFEID